MLIFAKMMKMDMKLKGVIFDFNGTLFWDTPLHDIAWDNFLENHQIRLTKKQKAQKIHGKTNADILKGLFDRDLSAETIHEMTMEKEKIYQQICLQQKMDLAPGAVDFINKLKMNKIKYTIATSSGWENVEFYIKNLKLEEWFDLNILVYNDGSFRGKPEPDIFIKAFDILNIKAEEALIFEDSVAGIQSAENSGAGKIIIVNSNNEKYERWPYQVISDFGEVAFLMNE